MQTLSQSWSSSPRHALQYCRRGPSPSPPRRQNTSCTLYPLVSPLSLPRFPQDSYHSSEHYDRLPPHVGARSARYTANERFGQFSSPHMSQTAISPRATDEPQRPRPAERRTRVRKVATHGSSRRRSLHAWTEAEDERLTQLVNELGTTDTNRQGTDKWSAIEAAMAGPSMKQCRERWVNHVDPSIKHGAFTEQESVFIIQQCILYGQRWADMSRCDELRGRPDNAIKNHFNTNLREHYVSLCASLDIAPRQSKDRTVMDAALFERIKDRITVPALSTARGRRSSRFVAQQDDGDGDDDASLSTPSPPRTLSTWGCTRSNTTASSSEDDTAMTPRLNSLSIHRPIIDRRATAKAFAAITRATALDPLATEAVRRFRPVLSTTDPARYVNFNVTTQPFYRCPIVNRRRHTRSDASEASASSDRPIKRRMTTSDVPSFEALYCAIDVDRPMQRREERERHDRSEHRLRQQAFR